MFHSEIQVKNIKNNERVSTGSGFNMQPFSYKYLVLAKIYHNRYGLLRAAVRKT